MPARRATGARRAGNAGSRAGAEPAAARGAPGGFGPAGAPTLAGLMTADRTYALHRLPTGARLIAAPMRERRSAAVAFMFGVGSRHEDAPSAGLSHFIEHVVFKGGGRFPTARAISEAIESVGGSINAATDKEATVFYTKVPAEHLGLACEVLGGMVFDPVLDAAEVAKERQVVIEELRMCLDNPQEHVGTLFDEVMYPDQPLGWDVAGTEETVRSFDEDACRRHLDGHYRPARLVVSMAGAVDPAQALELVERSVGRVGEATDAPPAAAAERHGSALRLVNKRTEQANIILGVRLLLPRPPPLRPRSAQHRARGGDVQPALPGAARGASPGLRRPLVRRQAAGQRLPRHLPGL